MRLGILFLLVTLALCCHQDYSPFSDLWLDFDFIMHLKFDDPESALCQYPEQTNAVTCPFLFDEITHFLMGDKYTFKMLLESYNPPAEAIEAKMEVKKCVDQVTLEHKVLLANILEKIVAECDS